MSLLILSNKKYSYYTFFVVFLLALTFSFLYKNTAIAATTLCSVGWDPQVVEGPLLFDQNGGSLGNEDLFTTTPVCRSAFGVDPCTGLATAVICEVSRDIQSCNRTIKYCAVDNPIFGITTNSELISQTCSSQTQYQQTCSPQGQGCNSHSECNVNSNGIPNGTSCLICDYYGGQTTTRACQTNPAAPSSCVNPGTTNGGGGGACVSPVTVNTNGLFSGNSMQQGVNASLQFSVYTNDSNNHTFTASMSGCNNGLSCTGPSSGSVTSSNPFGDSVLDGAVYTINTDNAAPGIYNLALNVTADGGTCTQSSQNYQINIEASRQAICNGNWYRIPSAAFSSNLPVVAKYYASPNLFYAWEKSHISFNAVNDGGGAGTPPGNVVEQRCEGGDAATPCTWLQDWSDKMGVSGGPNFAWDSSYSSWQATGLGSANQGGSSGGLYLGLNSAGKKTIWARTNLGVAKFSWNNPWVSETDSNFINSIPWNTPTPNNSTPVSDPFNRNYKVEYRNGCQWCNPPTSSGFYYTCSAGLGGTLNISPSGSVPYGTASANLTWSSTGAKVCGVFVQSSGMSGLGYNLGTGFEYNSSHLAGNNIPYNNLAGPAGAFSPSVKGNNLVMQLYCSPNADGSNGNIVANASISQIVPPPATVDLKVNGSDGPTVTLSSGQDVPLSWSYSGATSCSISAPASISGYPSGSGTVQTGALASPGRTYSMNCTNAAGVNSSDQVVVNIPAPMSLTVIKSGQGTVVSSPAGISCLAGCPSQTYGNFISNQVVVLTATPSPGRVFTGWLTSDGSSCPINAGRTCTVTMNQSKTVTANFVVDPNYREF